MAQFGKSLNKVNEAMKELFRDFHIYSFWETPDNANIDSTLPNLMHLNS